jgi:hypothetical protein
MHKILLNGKPSEILETYLPLLIHGKDGSGASFFTITLTASFLNSGSKVIFLCGYKMAQDELIKQIPNISEENFLLYTKDQAEEFINTLSMIENTTERIIIIKNIELFAEDIFDQISSYQKIIISGDINECVYKEKIMNKPYEGIILFSNLNKISLPPLEKHKGYLKSKSGEGLISLELVK